MHSGCRDISFKAFGEFLAVVVDCLGATRGREGSLYRFYRLQTQSSRVTSSYIMSSCSAWWRRECRRNILLTFCQSEERYFCFLPWFSSFLVNTGTAHCRTQFIPYLWSLGKRFFNNGVVMSHLHTCTNYSLPVPRHTHTHKDWLTLCFVSTSHRHTVIRDALMRIIDDGSSLEVFSRQKRRQDCKIRSVTIWPTNTWKHLKCWTL